MVSNIQKSSTFSQFRFYEQNRPLIRQHIDNLKLSIKSNNKLDVNPIIVNEEFYVIDGQHRLMAAKELKTPIYYIVDKNSDVKDMILENSVKRNWSLNDFIHFHSQSGNDDFLFVKSILDYCHSFTKSSVPPYIVFGRFSKPGDNRVLSKSIKDGTLKMVDREKVLDFVNTTMPFCANMNKLLKSLRKKKIGHSVFFKKPFFAALAACYISLDRKQYGELLDCLERDFAEIRDVANINDVITLFSTSYNRKKSVSKINLYKLISEVRYKIGIAVDDDE